jgi:hypothetical protein
MLMHKERWRDLGMDLLNLETIAEVGIEKCRDILFVLTIDDDLDGNAAYNRLVLCYSSNEGYRRFSLIRASSVVKRQLMVVLA